MLVVVFFIAYRRSWPSAALSDLGDVGVTCSTCQPTSELVVDGLTVSKWIVEGGQAYLWL